MTERKNLSVPEGCPASLSLIGQIREMRDKLREGRGSSSTRKAGISSLRKLLQFGYNGLDDVSLQAVLPHYPYTIGLRRSGAMMSEFRIGGFQLLSIGI